MIIIWVLLVISVSGELTAPYFSISFEKKSVQERTEVKEFLKVYSHIFVNNKTTSNENQIYRYYNGQAEKLEQGFDNYIRFKMPLNGYRFDETVMKNKHFTGPIYIPVINASIASHHSFYSSFLKALGPASTHFVLDINSQFDFAVWLEVYRRHCPTFILYDPITEEVFHTYAKFTGDSEVDLPYINQVLSQLKAGKYSSIRLGWRYLYTK